MCYWGGKVGLKKSVCGKQKKEGVGFIVLRSGTVLSVALGVDFFRVEG